MDYEKMTKEELLEVVNEDMRLQQEEQAARILRFSAHSMPDGWYWKEINGCGALYAPSGESYFDYDLNTFGSCMCGFAYKDEAGMWKFFDGMMNEFYRYAEKIAMEKWT